MFTYNDISGTFALKAGGGAFSFTGVLFRCVPHSSAEPLSGEYSQNLGGRWNFAGSFPVLYTCGSVSVARSFVASRATYYGFSWDERPEEDRPDLVVLELGATLIDLATDAGLQAYSLPTTYPIGYQTPAAYAVTRPIGQQIYSGQAEGLVTRSATCTAWTGPIPTWAEVALFTERAKQPRLLDRIPYLEWREE